MTSIVVHTVPTVYGDATVSVAGKNDWLMTVPADFDFGDSDACDALTATLRELTAA